MELTKFIEELLDIKLKPYQKLAIENFKYTEYSNGKVPSQSALKPTITYEGFGRFGVKE